MSYSSCGSEPSCDACPRVVSLHLQGELFHCPDCSGTEPAACARAKAELENSLFLMVCVDHAIAFVVREQRRGLALPARAWLAAAEERVGCSSPRRCELPKTPRAAAKVFRRAAADLQMSGWNIEFKRTHGVRRIRLDPPETAIAQWLREMEMKKMKLVRALLDSRC